MTQRSNVEVAIRVRPIRAEIGESDVNWDVQGKVISEKPNPDSRFTFDRIYGPRSTTTELYSNSVRDTIIKSVVKGYNGTVFAYGQTGSGKSFTMLGDGLAGQNEGVVSMAVKDLFAALEKEKADRKDHQQMEINVYVAMLEIYNEQLRDLLSPPGSVALPLSIRENEHGVYVHNAIRRPIRNSKECLHIIHNEAESRRVSASTAMNERSSRSHCLIRILVEKTISYDDDSDDSSDGEESGVTQAHEKKVVSSLNLVDLAGSERVAKTGATGQRMVEGGHINKSLTILTTVINRLTEEGGKTVTHVPYRDSKLTHLLKTALGGNSFTTVFCCMTFAAEHTDESRSTLQFAARAKTIRNAVTLNEVADSRTRLRELEIEYKKARRMLVATTIYLWSKNIKIQRLREGGFVATAAGSAVGGASGAPSAAAASSVAAASGVITTTSGDVVDAAQVEQMQMLIEQLTEQNEKLQTRLTEAVTAQKKAAAAAAIRGPAHVDPTAGGGVFADDPEKRKLRKEIEELHEMVEEFENEATQAKENLAELETVVEDLEEENESKDQAVNEANKRVKMLEIEVRNHTTQEKTYQKQIEALRQQVQNSDRAALDRARGDELMESLTKLHMDHQTLQFENNELLSTYSKMELEKSSQIDQLNERLAEARRERDADRIETSNLTSYCWRLLNVANLAAEGKPLAESASRGAIREHTVDQAVKSLTAFVSSRASKPPAVIEVAPGNEHAIVLDATTTASGKSSPIGAAGSGEKSSHIPCQDESEYKQKILDLEKIIMTKDAQRDIIIDTKLKRIQELVLRLQATNLRLASEVKNVVEDNHGLFGIIKKEPRLSKALNKTKYQPVSEEEIMLRALTAPAPQRPMGHI